MTMAEYEVFKQRLENGFLTWKDEDKSYHDVNGKRYAEDGEELINAKLDETFEDVKKIVKGGWG